MYNQKSSHGRIASMTALALLTALVAVLQLLGSSFRIGAIPFSLVLVPITVGACVLGVRAGMFLGGVFGVMCLIGGISGSDAFTFMLWSASPFWTIAVCMGKGIACGGAAGLVYRLAQKKQTLACILAAICCPIVNTGIFALMMLTVLRGCLEYYCAQVQWAGDLMNLLFIGMIGVNFLVEFSINCIVSSAIARIVKAVQNRRNMRG